MISRFSVKKPYTVLVGVVLAIILGVVSFTRMTADLLPSISLPYVIVMTTYPGASPETVEMAVTQPVEASMATVSNIESISSVSAENYSMVVLEFAQTADMNAVSLEIRESLDQIKSYWDDSVGNPIIMKLNPDMLPVMIAAVGVDGMDNGAISTYVQESIMPELESIEGVASVSATGLLEESVHVIIRQDKVDELNEKVFAAVDDKMKEAEEELEDGRKQLEDGRKEISDGWKELNDGRKELEDGRQELVDGQKELDENKDKLDEGKDALAEGKEQLNDAQAATAAQLAAKKTELLALKAQLDNMKSNLDSVKQLSDQIDQIAKAKDDGTPAKLGEAIGGLQAIQSQVNNLPSETNPDDIKVQLMQMSGMSEELLQMIDWNTMDSVKSSLQNSIDAMTEQKESLEALIALLPDLEAELAVQTYGQGYEDYVKEINTAIAAMGMTDLTTAIATINAGLAELEKGEMTAAIEFANGKASISLGEYQMNLADSQLEAAQKQIDSGWDAMKDAQEQLDSAADQLKEAQDQLKEAEDQLKEGEEQLEDARQHAYDSADLNGILTVEAIEGLLTAQNFSMPAGYVTEEGIDYMVRVGDKPSTVEELQALPLLNLHMDGVPVITLGDVADVFYTDNSDEIYANVDGSAGIMLTIQKQTGYSTGEVSDLLAERFAELMDDNPDLSLITLMDQGIYIDLVMDSIINNILFGAVLAILILLVFLKDFRPTMVVAFSIPISLVTAIVCMYFSGVTLNVISLSGLALGIGMLVDNSIVVIENIYRLRSEGYSVQEAAIKGSKEVSGAIMASTLTTVCVFLPIVFTEGITRQLFVDMGLTIAYSLLASLAIALTVVPAMSSKLLVKTKEQKEGRFFKGMTKGYEKLLSTSLKVKPVVFVLVLALLAASVALAFSNGTAFMSDMDSNQLTVNVQLADDAALSETAALTDQVVDAILSIEDVQNVGAMTGGSDLSLLGGSSTGGATNATSIYVVTRDDKSMSNEEIADIIEEKTAGLDAEITIDTSSMDMSALGGSGISIQVRGRDLDTLQRIAGEVAAILESVEGTADVSDGLEEAEEELRVLIDREKAVDYGLTVAQVFTQIAAKLAAASSSTTLVAADKDYSVYVMNGSDIELTRELVKEIEITGTDEDGESVKVPLSDLASFEPSYALTSINRAEQTRYVQVSAAIAEGYNVGLVSDDVEEALAGYEVPSGYQLVFSGENEMIEDAMGQMVLMLVLAVAFMYLIMVAQFQSLLSPFIIMFTIPLAFTGGFLGLFVSGSEVSVIAMIGFVMLAGIIVNNGIVLIDYMNQLREGGMEKREAILTAGRTRLRPVLMTALTTILALSTMVFSSDMGSEMGRPMAIVTIGGLLYGTLLTLVVIPCVYDIMIREKKQKGEIALEDFDS
ncbi:MAG: efflux RND transporter permease subunit [Eubacterium sp.]|nr:efflux RND transporter permease subunit [Eubacterium sp.]